MTITDFSKAYFLFRIDFNVNTSESVTHKPPYAVNNVRINLDCVCFYTSNATGKTTIYGLGASCKTEIVGVDRDIWTMPNADFKPVVSNERIMILKNWGQSGFVSDQDVREKGAVDEREFFDPRKIYTRFELHIPTCEAQSLTPAEVVTAAFDNRPLVSRTEFDTPGGDHVVLEYPVKTVNVHDEKLFYQVDTGPVLFPDPDDPGDDVLAEFRLAYVAHRLPEWAEFILNMPTPVNDEISINHYSKPVRIEGTMNRMFAVS